jgi:phosphoribosylformimino-5-aminoimidazole carboxamide ribotide isomerase
MRIIPVIDLLNGVVVGGIAGRREAYRPMKSSIAADCQPASIARAFADDFGFDTVYVADLDAIQRGMPNVAAWSQIAAAGLKLWLDSGIGNSTSAGNVLGLLASCRIDARIVVGLESLESASELGSIRAVCGNQPPIFSLDLNTGQPLTRIAAWQNLVPLEMAKSSVAAGYRDLIVLDLADVGTNSGTRTLELCREIRNLDIPMLNVIAGGGVRSLADLERIKSAGCDAALVASALHDKRLMPADIRRATN